MHPLRCSCLAVTSAGELQLQLQVGGLFFALCYSTGKALISTCVISGRLEGFICRVLARQLHLMSLQRHVPLPFVNLHALVVALPKL
jgi:hypothetical protein